MHPGVVRHILSPLLERMLGRRTFANLCELDRSQWWPPERLRESQAGKLKALLTDVAAHCPYYRRTFAAHGVAPNRDEPFAALARLPLLDKPAIRSHLSEMTHRAVPGGPIRFCTGGSTGEPLVFFVDRRRIGYDKAARILTHYWFGAEPGDREVYLWGSPVELRGQDYLKRIRDRLTNEMLLEAFNLSPASMSRYLRRINAFDPVSIFGYPSSLATLAEYGASVGQKFTGRRLKAVFVTGELLESDHRRMLQMYFGAPVVNGYGSRDGGFIAHDCPHGRMHIFDQNLIVEIVDAAGRPIIDGRHGEIVVTHLDALATPLIRYRTGDVGCLLDGQCSCGRGMSMMGMVAGRQTDHLVAADGSLQHALSAIYCLRELTTVAQFQLRQKIDRSVDVYVVPNDDFGPHVVDRIRVGIRRQLGWGIEVNVLPVTSIAAEDSGKYRHVISDAARNRAAKPASCERTEGAA